MKIMIFDVPAENGGALSILEDVYEAAKAYNLKDIHWIFVVSKPRLQETENIEIIRFPWVKNSWLHRLYFDQVVAPKIVKNYQPDRIFSLQNVIIPRTRTEQILYVHQSLPFVDYKFGFNENKLFWFYQNILSRAIYKSIKKSRKVILQSNWFKDACIEKTGENENKFSVVWPQVSVKVDNSFIANSDSLSTFFYPAGAGFYKNHNLIVEACEFLKENNFSGYKVIFTLCGNENAHIIDLYKRVKEKNLPIEFVGKLSREEVFQYYTTSVLIFPSYIETFGLPILESKIHHGLVLAADTPFSHEILDGYPNAYFFKKFDSKGLATLLKNVSTGYINYTEKISDNTQSKDSGVSLIDEIVYQK